MTGAEGLSPVSIHVDVDELSRLHTEIQGLRDDLVQLSGHQVDADPVPMGGHDVADAIQHFVDNWRDGRQRITDNLGKCVDLVGAALAAYQQEEAVLGNAISGAGPADGGAS